MAVKQQHEQGGAQPPAPSAPEGYPERVRRELQQYGQTHQGEKESAEGVAPGSAQHLGATGTAVTPIKPPMRGPSDLIGEQADAPGEGAEDAIDPADELTPG